ncbi:MAG: hypothetical protein ACREQF_03005 [Candidatus Binataceae bacterium]
MAKNSTSKVVPLREGNVLLDVDAQRLTTDAVSHSGAESAHWFPTVSTSPRLPAMIPDEILDYYGWVFCQGGFTNLQMTFEQFLSVVAAVSPTGLCPEYDGSDTTPMLD